MRRLNLLTQRRPIPGGSYHRRVPRSRLVSLWLPVVAWAALIFALSSIPSLDSGLAWDTLLRKIAHVAEYAILGALFLRALRRPVPAWLSGVAYAVTDEFHQHFVAGRHGAPVDVAIDALGVLVGVVIFWRWRT
jgi:VanZ family protein